MKKWESAYFAVGNAQWCALKSSLTISYKIESITKEKFYEVYNKVDAIMKNALQEENQNTI